MRNLKYQLNKAEKPITDPAIVVPECYHDILDLFSKKALNKILPYLKYNHKIELLAEDKNYRQAALKEMSKPQLECVSF